MPTPGPEFEKLLLSGLLEGYCLGILEVDVMKELDKEVSASQSLKQEIHDYQERFIRKKSKRPLSSVWDKIKLDIDQEETVNLKQSSGHLSGKMDLNQLRKEASEVDFPDIGYSNIAMVPFKKILDFQQFLIRIRKFVPIETHDNMLESFFVLEGSCNCTIGDSEISLSEGGFAEIPLNKPHFPTVTSTKPVLAILQRGLIY